MFSDLNHFLDIDIGQLPTGKCILTVEISGSNGSFVLHHFLSLALRGETAVCFVALAQTFHHYACIGNKLNLNFSRLRDSGKLTFVDGLSLIGSDFVKSCIPSSVPDQTGSNLCDVSAHVRRKNKAPGVDVVGIRMLMELAEEISYSVAELFNISAHQHYFISFLLTKASAQ